MPVRAAFCESAARQLAKRAGLSVPIDVNLAAAHLGLRVLEKIGLRDSGYLVLGEKTIYVPRSEHVERRRFTVAHELGHYCLDHERFRLDFPDETTASGRPTWESEADRFAGALLMPREQFAADFRALGHIGEIARRYGVSPSAATVRLKELRLV